MNTVCVVKRIPVSAQAAWMVIRTGGQMDRWVPAISACQVDGEGAGAKRVCVVDGHDLLESIEVVDDEARVFQYRIHRQSLMPIRNVLGTIHVTEITPSEAEVLWFVSFEVDDPSSLPAVKAGIQALYASGIDGLSLFVKQAHDLHASSPS